MHNQSRISHFLSTALSTVTLILLLGHARHIGAQARADGADQNACFDPQAVIELPEVCGVRFKDLPQISCYLPPDVPGELAQSNFNVVQRAADIFSWQEFIALNWPAQSDERGVPNHSARIGDPGPRVWETWKEDAEVYLPSGSEPPVWNSPLYIPNACGQGKLLARQQKIDDLLDANLQAAASNGTLPATLTDQRGNLVRYEIRMNKVLFQYIRENGLYNADQQARVRQVDFPDGSILIKAAWRVMTADDDQSRFYVAEACVCDMRDGRPVDCRPLTMGLVGFHIMQKTPSASQWIWSTFEQVDNVTGSDGRRASFNAPYCTSCRINAQTPKGTPAQVTRVIPIPSADADCADPGAAVDNIAELNRIIQAALAKQNSGLQYYELINTQWPIPRPSDAAETRDTVFEVVPPILSNLTMETYIQETSSCMGCHAMARTVNPNRYVSSDFSFTLNNAQPAQTNSRVIPGPQEPVTGWDKENWSRILRGRQLSSQTYELLPQYVTAKLHCGSCHLEVGGDPDAAWWVGMVAKYNYPATEGLQNRINRCFMRSMNGKPICSTTCAEDNCGDDSEMIALITYMQWLDEQYNARYADSTKRPPPANGFPPIRSLAGDAARGQAIFAQKCAFCHGRDGQGRYENDSYYRPALWGPFSFNASAGMAKPKTLASFIRANMPWKHGGELTAQEAWDLAVFIDMQWRPKEVDPSQ